MADVRGLLRNEQVSRRITHPNLAYTKSGLLNCLVCNLVIKSGSLWEGHLRSANHKKNVQQAQNSELQDVNGKASKKRKLSDEAEDVRKKRKSIGVDQEGVTNGELQGPEGKEKLPGDNSEDDVAGPAMPDDRDPSPAPQSITTEAPVSTEAPHSGSQPHIDEDEWAAFEREVVPLTHQAPPTRPTDYSATISAAPVSAAELAAETNAERQQRREAEVEDEKAEEQTRLVEEFEVMEGLEERVKRLKERREALRVNAGAMEDDTGQVETEAVEAPPDPDEEEDDSDEIDEWGFT